LVDFGSNAMPPQTEEQQEQFARQRRTPYAELAQQDIDRIIARLDVSIPEAQKAMDELLTRLRSTRIAA
jgi:hypothetical protein